MTAPARIATTIALLLLIISHGWPQEQVTPAWVLYEQGMEHLSSGRYGEALRLFRAASSRRPPFPEADYGIGQVFHAEGSFDLALRHYRSALQNSGVLELPETAYLIRYDMAEVHRIRGEQQRFEQELRDIAVQESAFSDPALEERRAAYLSVLREQGLDRLMVLYRVDDGFSHRAHRELGVHLVDTNRCTDALPHLTFAAMKGISTIAAELRREQFDYAYTTAGLTIADALDRRYLASYLEREGLFRTLYYLALALSCVSPDSATPMAIWRTLASEPAADEWHRRALQRLPGPLLRRR